MRIAIASDHAGYELKEHVKAQLTAKGHDVVDVGPDSDESVDYPRYAAPAARLVAEGDAERGVLVCGSGVGVSIVANKVPGVRAVNAHDPEEAQLARAHNDVNVVTLSGRRLDGDAGRRDRRGVPQRVLRGRPPLPPRRGDRAAAVAASRRAGGGVAGPAPAAPGAA